MRGQVIPSAMTRSATYYVTPGDFATIYDITLPARDRPSPSSDAHRAIRWNVFVQAEYSGTATAVPSTSAAVSVKLTAAASTTMLTASPSSVTPPADVTLTATVASADGTPTGSVTFYDGTLSLGAVDLSAGKASLAASTKGLAAGSYPVHAEYSGSANISSSVSSNVTVTVK